MCSRSISRAESDNERHLAFGNGHLAIVGHGVKMITQFAFSMQSNSFQDFTAMCSKRSRNQSTILVVVDGMLK
jgi:hypothetical protein